MEPPPSHGLIRYPLGSISALTKGGTGGMLGPFWVLFSDLSHTYTDNLGDKEMYNLDFILLSILCK